jgi:hypothetical protein
MATSPGASRGDDALTSLRKHFQAGRPFERPNTSGRSVVIAVATTTAIETTWNAWLRTSVGDVDVEVRKGRCGPGAGAERGDNLVEAGADPRYFGLADGGVDAERGDQVVDRPGGGTVDVGLNHHRIQRLVDASRRSEDDREEQALPAVLGSAARRRRRPEWQATGHGR